METGLTTAEVHARVAAGQTNAVRARTSRSIWEILRANVFTWFNLVLGSLLVLILTYGSWRDGLFGLVLVANSAIGVAQEVRAKRTLDRLALVTAPRARVVRDGAPTEVAVAEVVLDDVVALVPGDQLVVDAVVLESAGLEVDESALSGEANPVPKAPGDTVMSGSFVVAGSGLCRATAVGADAWAAGVERVGRKFTRTRSDIMDGINAILKVIGLLLLPVGALTVYRNAQRTDLREAVTDTVATLVAMVPEGLVLLSSVAFAVSALALARRHVLVNELNAVETLARTDVVCVDKTGTLTDREPTFARFEPLASDDPAPSPSAADYGPAEAPGSAAGPGTAAAPDPDDQANGEVLAALGALVRCDPAANATMRAIAAGVPETAGWSAVATVPFSSARKWSAADFGEHGTWVIGAPDVLLRASQGSQEATLADAPEVPQVDTVARPPVDALADSPQVTQGDTVARPQVGRQLADLVAERVRVLLLARAPALSAGTTLPSPLEPAGFVVLTEKVRPDARDTVRYLSSQGISLRVISGDDARTVASIAAAVGLEGAAVDARGIEPDALREAMEGAVVFGRVLPEQKSAMLEVLQGEGHTVAMTGDGVNDVIALKQADLGIAMGSGVPAARAVAQVVLLDDRFASVPHLMAEGRRVVTNAERVANLFLTKSVWAGVVALSVAALDLPYPFLPRQITFVGSLAIGIPAFFFALDRTARRYRPGFVRRVMRFAVPAGLVLSVAVLGTHAVAMGSGMDVAEARVLNSVVLLVASLGVITVLEWPLTGWRLAVVGAMAAGGAITFAIPWVREFFVLGVPSPEEFAAAVAVGAVAGGLVAALTVKVRRDRGRLVQP